VLRYLPTMLTFVEIGSELYISVNTTKRHVRSIHRKLGVVGRRDAVRRPASSSYSDPEGRRSLCWRAMAKASCREATPSLR
jgi:hypothetical protein